ncbi:MAG: hypothetical protein ACREC6_15425 [Hyphomicrobiaceae bacterium]
MKSLAKTVAAIILLIGSGLPSGVTPALAQTHTGIFVGTVAAERPALVAVLVDPVPGTANSRVRAYFCDGVEIAVWAEGTVAGTTADLTSKEGDRVQVQLAGDGATGTLILPDGRKSTFSAPRAASVSGLYEVDVAPGGRVHGASIPGEKFEFRTQEGSGAGPVAVKFTLPDGKSQDFQMPPVAVEPGRYRLIALIDKAGALHMLGGTVATPRRFYSYGRRQR